MNISKQIGWSNESNLLYQILKQLNRLTSIIFSLKPKYKVWVGLVNQNGGDNNVVIYNEKLNIGTTYTIFDNGGSGWDFTNVGAPNNNLGTSFIATGTTPTSWGVDGALSYNSGAPIAKILENTIGNITFSYLSSGIYSIISSEGLFTIGKTVVFITTNSKNTGLAPTQYQVIVDIEESNQPNMLHLYTGDVLGNTSDNLIQDGYPATLEIRIYN